MGQTWWANLSIFFLPSLCFYVFRLNFFCFSISSCFHDSLLAARVPILYCDPQWFRHAWYKSIAATAVPMPFSWNLISFLISFYYLCNTQMGGKVKHTTAAKWCLACSYYIKRLMHNCILFPQQGSFCETAGGGEARQGSPTYAEQSSLLYSFLWSTLLYLA